MTITRRSILCGIALGACLALAPSTSDAQCTVSFSDDFALRTTFKKARDSIAFRSQMRSDGTVVECKDLSGDNWRRCWSYRQRCGLVAQTGRPAYSNVWPIDQAHWHLGFTNPLLNNGCFCNPGDGLGLGFQFGNPGACGPSSGSCPDWAAHPRYAVPHASNATLFIWTESPGDGGLQHIFDFQSIVLGQGPAAQIWFTLTNGSVVGLTRLEGSTVAGQTRTYTFNLPDVVAVWILAAGGEGGPPTIVSYSTIPRS